MRLSDREAAPVIRERLESLGRTGLSIVYAERSESHVAIKAIGFWLDGGMYDHASFAEDNDEAFKREAAIYDALGPHEHILKSFGLAYSHTKQDETSDPSVQCERQAWAIKPERAPHGNLRERIMDGDAPSMAQRLKLALDVAETLQYIHSRGVTWGDISTRNILLFDNLHIKLSDFAGSSLEGVYSDLLFVCKPRYWIPDTNSERPERTVFEKEMFALGTCICEITQWALLYGDIEILSLIHI